MPSSATISLVGIIEAIQQLSPTERRQLQRRLYASGLFVPTDLSTDQNRLKIAPALGGQSVARQPAPPMSTRISPIAPVAPPTPPGPPATNAQPLLAYRAPISGKVVVGSPSSDDRIIDPHVMAPLPGQAPARPIQIIFDGGSKGNPGLGYGSYMMRWPGEQPQLVRLQFGTNATNNEAEYDTLIGALEAISKRLKDAGADPASAQLDIRGDSLLVINQVKGEWQCKEERLKPRLERVRQLLQPFGLWRLTHHNREKSVELLGH